MKHNNQIHSDSKKCRSFLALMFAAADVASSVYRQAITSDGCMAALTAKLRRGAYPVEPLLAIPGGQGTGIIDTIDDLGRYAKK